MFNIVVLNSYYQQKPTKSEKNVAMETTRA